jgi:hypothetical protein
VPRGAFERELFAFSRWVHAYIEGIPFFAGLAAVLIGLIFVVISLMQDRSRSTVLAGARLYMGPIVLSVSFVLALSAAALTPHIETRTVALISGSIALWGLVRGIMSITGIRGLCQIDESPPHWSDVWFYGVAPSVLYLALGLVAFGFGTGAPWAREGLAAAITGLMLVAIRNEWDLITWIAPHSEAGKAQ